MKKIDFGFNDDRRLNSSFSGIEPYNGDYLDMFCYENMDFLVTIIVDSHRGLNGNIDVREVSQDYYADGSYVNYANKEKNALCQKFEQLLNTPNVRKKIDSGETPLNILRAEGFPVHMSYLRDMAPKSEKVSSIVTSVTPDKFKKLKDSKKTNHGTSFYDMTEEIVRLREKIAELNASKGKSY